MLRLGPTTGSSSQRGAKVLGPSAVYEVALDVSGLQGSEGERPRARGGFAPSDERGTAVACVVETEAG
jgi:hypothetical protein